MARVAATRELLAPPEHVWRFLAEPLHLADWWPGVRAVRPDRRGLAPGARWQLTAGTQTGGLVSAFLRRPESAGTIVVLDVREPESLRLLFVADRIEAELLLERAGWKPHPGDAHDRRALAADHPLAARVPP